MWLAVLRSGFRHSPQDRCSQRNTIFREKKHQPTRINKNRKVSQEMMSNTWPNFKMCIQHKQVPASEARVEKHSLPDSIGTCGRHGLCVQTNKPCLFQLPASNVLWLAPVVSFLLIFKLLDSKFMQVPASLSGHVYKEFARGAMGRKVV